MSNLGSASGIQEMKRKSSFYDLAQQMQKTN